MKVKLGKYKGYSFEKPNIIVEEKEIEDNVNLIRKEYKVDFAKEGSITKGDYIKMDYNGYYNGELLKEACGHNYHLRIGKGYFIKEFEDNLIGKNVGDDVEFNVLIPDDYHTLSLQNKTLHFKVKINEVKHRIVPELNDDVVKTFEINGVNSVAELKEFVKDQLSQQKLYNNSANILNDIMEKITNDSEVILDEEKIKETQTVIFEDFKDQLEKKRFSLEDYYSHTNQTEVQLLESCRIEAETYLTEKAILEEIGIEEEIVVTKEEFPNNDATEEDIDQLFYHKVIRFLLNSNIA